MHVTTNGRASAEAQTMKCQKCSKAAILHITEVLGETQFEEHHLCEECGNKYLADPSPPTNKKAPKDAPVEESVGGINPKPCEACGIKFVEFRNSGRLGCPHDYDHFRAELLPLLENIHGEIKHAGKTPRRLPATKQLQQELATLRKQLNVAVNQEAYEEAARLRDRIRQLESA
jgi:protein arginine kinase activator